MKRVALVIGAVLLLAPALSAADLTGKWSGPLVLTGPDGSSQNSTLVMDLKQTGMDLTGTAAPEGQTPAPLKGKVDGDKVNFDVEVSNEGLTIHFALTMADGHLKGNLSAEVGGMKLSGTVDAQKK
jgi:hypothetical protein